MSQEFDPYNTWLGIPPTEQPPNHYRLLGVREFEHNPQQIQIASDQRMLYIRTFQNSKQAAFSQRLLNEISTAQATLLSPQKKQAYDAQLRASQASAPAREKQMMPPPPAAIIPNASASRAPTPAAINRPPAGMPPGMNPPGNPAAQMSSAPMHPQGFPGPQPGAPGPGVKVNKPPLRRRKPAAGGNKTLLFAVIGGVALCAGLCCLGVGSMFFFSGSETSQTTVDPPNEPVDPNAPTPVDPSLPTVVDTHTDPKVYPTMVRIEPGEFRMGSPFQETGREVDETAHQVKFAAPFYIAAHETTQEQFSNVMSYNPSYFAELGGGKRFVDGVNNKRFPVENVSFYDALLYCNRLSQRANLKPYYTLSNVDRAEQSIRVAKVVINGGSGFRLPTEAEWEYACRASTTTATAFGDSLSSNQANFDGAYPFGAARTGPYLAHPAGVGSYLANRWGVYDMHGNVSEWVFDYYDSGYYTSSLLHNPTGPSHSDFRVNRGGSWYSPGVAIRSAERKENLPGAPSQMIGFRVARSVQ